VYSAHAGGGIAVLLRLRAVFAPKGEVHGVSYTTCTPPSPRFTADAVGTLFFGVSGLTATDLVGVEAVLSILTFGDAGFFGSMGEQPLNKPVIGGANPD
jgi:hypothetical protein